MDAERFAALAREGYTRIPLTLQLRADLDTPLSAYLKLADGDDAYLLESVAGGETWGRYSIIGLPAAERVSIADSVFRRHRHGELTGTISGGRANRLCRAPNCLFQDAPPELGRHVKARHRASTAYSG